MYFDDIKLGMTVEIAPAVIEKEKMLSFARDYDNIPLHTDEEYAKKDALWQTDCSRCDVLYVGLGKVFCGFLKRFEEEFLTTTERKI